MNNDCYRCENLDCCSWERNRPKKREFCKAKNMMVDTDGICPEYTNETVREFEAIVDELETKVFDISDDAKPEDVCALNDLVKRLKRLDGSI